MADKKISQLTGATTPLAGTEVLPIVQGGSTVKVAVSNLTAGRTVDGTNFVANSGSLSANAGAGSYYVNVSAAYNFPYMDAYVDSVASTSYEGRLTLRTNSGGGAMGDRVVITNDGNVTVSNGNLKVGTAAKGIDFSANTGAAGMTSELLNWYEEGTWTPDLKFGGANTGITYSSRSGTYTRIGRMVHARATIVLSSNGSASGGATVTGLPFNCAVTTAASIYQDGIAYTGTLNVAVEGTVDRFTIQQVSEAGANSNLARTNFSNTASFTLSVCYQV